MGITSDRKNVLGLLGVILFLERDEWLAGFIDNLWNKASLLFNKS